MQQYVQNKLFWGPFRITVRITVRIKIRIPSGVTVTVTVRIRIRIRVRVRVRSWIPLSVTILTCGFGSTCSGYGSGDLGKLKPEP